MASQREWESVVWHFLGDHLRNTDNEYIKDWIYGFQPNTKTQDERWDSAVSKVYYQLQKFAGADARCDMEDCKGYHYGS